MTDASAHERVAELRRRLGTIDVITGADASRYLADWRGVFPGDALAVVRPASTDEVADVVRWCSETDTAVIPQGGNTGLSGGAAAVADQPCLVVSLERMNRIEEVDAAGSTLRAQAGCTIEALQQAARHAGRLFAPDWGARGTATLGGAIATDAGGINVLRYGNLRRHVLGIEVVLPDGRVWNGLRSLRKDSSGYDLKQLFVGSEGTLGIVTQATVSLEGARPHEQSAFAAMRDLDALMPLLDLAMRQAADSVVAFELIPWLGLERVTGRYGIDPPLSAQTEYFVLLKFAAPSPVTETLAGVLEAAARSGLIVDAVVAATADQEARLWQIRDELPIYRLFEHQAIALKNDTAVPVEQITTFLRAVRALADERVPGVVTYGFGHVGDGNLHIAVLPDDGDDPEPYLAARDDLRRAVDELVFALGGTLSAEHGIGRDLCNRIGPQKPAIEWEMMRSVKALFDPRGLMNPGALFPDETR
jgi:FAD/FMN-containing dehydrogenase